MNEFDNDDAGEEGAIAIVGMACHLPGALNLKQYWNNLRDGVESIRFYSDEELLAAGESPALLADPNYVRAQPYLENFDRFDAKFWGFSPQDAAVTDPAHRLFLEVAYQALEHSGHTGYDAEGTVGVFAASGASLYWMDNLKTNPQLINEMGEFLVRHTGNDMNFLATRLSYELDLRGPSLNVQTACSSSLVAVHMAVQSLLGGECDLAIAGASTVMLPQNRGYLYREGEIMSPDGHCRPFDANSAGTIFGSGTGAVVLRRLEDAITDGDTIYAVVAGSAINNDGAQKVGYLAPGVEGQAAVIAEALEIAGVEADEISFIESHGTGTQIGDPIEFEALNQVYRAATAKRDYCYVGSVKSNIGHLGEAAGAAAIIKVILALQNKQLPATINYESPNNDIELDDSPFLINNTLESWNTINGKRLAGITGLGAGGTNAHVIISEAPETVAPKQSDRNKFLLPLSAKTPTALQAACRNLALSLTEQTDIELADVAYTLQVGRRAYSHRLVLAVADNEDAIAVLEGSDPKRIAQATVDDKAPSLIFMFPGGGAQYAGMGAELYQKESVYREAFETCLNSLDKNLANEIRELVLATGDKTEIASKSLEQPSRTLPALLATEYALAKQLIAWGAEPVGFIGHSMGEYTAACLSGVISVNDAMRLVLKRGQLFEKVPLGGMLSISLSEADARQLMPLNLDIAAVNAPDLCVASGPVADIEQLQKKLEQNEIDCTRVRIDVAAHSSMLENILEEFQTFCETIKFSPPTIPFTSNFSGDWITDTEASNPKYWVQHLRNTVKFSDNVAVVVEKEPRVLVEVGPGTTLTNLALAGATKAQATFGAMRHPREQTSDVECALRTLGHIWAAGVTTNWEHLWGDEKRRRIPLPTYPFERKAYWIDPGAANTPKQESADSGIKKRPNIDDWFAQYNWSQSTLPLAPGPQEDVEKLAKDKSNKTWLLFEDELGISEHFVNELDETAVIIRVRPGDQFSQQSDMGFRLSPTKLDHFESLFAKLADTQNLHIVYLWPVTSSSSYSESSAARLKTYEKDTAIYFWALFNLSKVLSEFIDPAHLTVVSSDLHTINSLSCPEKAILLGPIAVLPHEIPHIHTKSIDVSPSLRKTDSIAQIAKQIHAEIQSDDIERVVAYRGTERWIRRIDPAPVEASSKEQTWLRNGGCYLITGGLGGIGLTIAHYLATLGAGTLILIGRSGLPERTHWQSWIEEHSADDNTVAKIQAVRNIESLGTKVLTLAADVTDLDNVSNVLKIAKQTIGDIHGVVHAAGSMDDQLIMMKSAESAKAVIESKIKGALILDSLIPADSLDFFVVFSSVAAYLGLPGQIDYTAANAFLDAFVKDRAQHAAGRSLAINWNAWRDIGMAAAVHKNHTFGENTASEMKRTQYPWLHHYVDTGDQKRLFSTRFSVENDWLISEHRIKNGDALIPGTGFIELSLEVFNNHCIAESVSGTPSGNRTIELSDVQFHDAFRVPNEKPRVLHFDIEGSAQGASISIYSETEDFPHAVANVRSIDSPRPAQSDLSALRERCKTQRTTKNGFLDQDFMDFGERWCCINNISSGNGEALLDIALPQQFLSDLNSVKLHPGLLDMAIGGAQFLIPGFNKEEDFYVPIAYQQFVVYADMPASFTSHVRLSDTSTQDFAIFDVTLVDEQGLCFAEITGFTMKKVAADFIDSNNEASMSDGGATQSSDALAEILQEAILPDEGVEAFSRVMSNEQNTQWIVSSIDSKCWMALLDNPASNDQAAERINYVKEETHNPDIDPDIPELEAKLLEHPAIEQIFVRSHLDENSGRRFIAHYMVNDYESATVSELRKYARKSLTPEMVPQHFVELYDLPLDESGNVDRTQLLDPFAPESKYVAPRTSTEIQLAKIWQDLLGVEKVGIRDNFFDIGGHSLISIRVIVRAKKTIGIRLDQAKMALLTLEQLAADIDQQSPVAPQTNVDIGRNKRDDKSPDKGKGANKLFNSLFGRK